MNFAGLLGLVAAIAIAAFSILDAADNPIIFADVHGIVIVIGGTVTVALMSFNFRKLVSALKILVRKTLGNEREDFQGVISQIVSLAETYRANPQGLAAALKPNAHPFLKDAVQLITDYGFDVDDLDDILSNALRGKAKRDQEENKVWHTLARFPPAFGLIGAVLGMISLLQTLGDPGAQDRIGPAMATALVATFYGLLVANLILLPIAEKLAVVSSTDRTVREIIKEGVLLIVEKKHPTFIAEYLQSFLAPKQRTLTSSTGAKGAGRAA